MFEYFALEKKKTDSLRGFALVLMILCHCTIQILDVNGVDRHWLLQVNALTSHIRMPLFMFLTGYIVALQDVRGNFRLVARIERLAIPFVVATIVILSVKAMATGRADLLTTIGHHLIVPYSHLWYLPALLLILATFAGAKQVVGNGDMAVAATVLIALLVGASGLEDTKLLALGNAAFLAPYFAAGYFIRALTVERNPRAGVVMALSTAAVVLAAPSVDAVGHFAAVSGAALALALLIPANAVLTFLGQRSLPIFLYHSLAISAVSRFLSVGFWPELVTAGTLAIAFPVALHWFITRRVPQVSILIGEQRRPPRRELHTQSVKPTEVMVSPV